MLNAALVWLLFIVVGAVAALRMADVHHTDAKPTPSAGAVGGGALATPTAAATAAAAPLPAPATPRLGLVLIGPEGHGKSLLLTALKIHVRSHLHFPPRARALHSPCVGAHVRFSCGGAAVFIWV